MDRTQTMRAAIFDMDGTLIDSMSSWRKLNADYIRTARAKGLSEKVVINRHAFRNTLIPLVSYLSYLVPSLFSGSMITETLYQIPGIGYIAYDAMVAGDLPFTMFYSVFGLVLTQVSLMLADIMYAVVDPRVRVN